MATNPSSILALDVGAKRIGVATASLIARLPHPLTTLQADDAALFTAIQALINQEDVGAVVVGFPRGLDGQHTAQTAAIEIFVEQLREQVSLPIYLQDEAVTSRHAEAELESRGKPFKKEDIDALAATYILDDWLHEHTEQVV